MTSLLHQIDKGQNAPDNERYSARQQLLSKLLGSGLMDTVKAHLRATLFAELKGTELQSGLAPSQSPNLQQHIVNCLVTEYLLQQQYKYTLSVFLAESGTHRMPNLSHSDLLRLIGLQPDSKFYQMLQSNSQQGCLTMNILQILGDLEAFKMITSASCQTEDQPASSNQLISRLKQIEEDYKMQSQQLQQQSRASLESQMMQYQRDCEARFAAQVKGMREVEMAAVKEQEAARYAQQMALERESMQKHYEDKLAKLHGKEEDLINKERRFQDYIDEEREQLRLRQQAEEERLKNWLIHEQKTLNSKDADMKLQLDQLERQKKALIDEQDHAEQLMQEQQKRFIQEKRQKEEDLLKQQAALDNERMYVSNSRANMAAVAADADMLRMQLATEMDNHMKTKAVLQHEVDSLQSQLRLLQRKLTEASERHQDCCAQSKDVAARKEQQQASQSASEQQEKAIHILKQRQAQLLQDLSIGRSREKLLRRSAGTYAMLVEKSSKWNELCLQHIEELRLDLTGAIRELGDLQQHAQLPAADARCTALSAAIRDAQRWTDAAQSRLEAASVQERHLRQEMVNIQEKATANRVQTAQDLQELLASYVHSMAGTFPILEPGCAAGHDGDAQSPSSASSLGDELEDHRLSIDGQAAACLPRQQRDPLSTLGAGDARSAPAPPTRTSHILAAYRARQLAASKTDPASSDILVLAQSAGPERLHAQLKASRGRGRPETSESSMENGCEISQGSKEDTPSCSLPTTSAAKCKSPEVGAQHDRLMPDKEDDCISDLSSESSKF